MIRMFGVIAVSVVLTASVSAAHPATQPPAPADQRLGEIYARQLVNLVTVICAQYVREAESAKLFESALTELYETTRQPVDQGLMLDLKKAQTLSEQMEIVALARARMGAVPELEGSRDLTVGIKGLAKALDPYCGLVLAHEFQNRGDTTLNFGFDLEGESPDVFLMRTRLPSYRDDVVSLPSIPFRVAAVRPGGPAQGAGMRPGDAITHIDGQLITAESAKAIYQDIFSAIDVTESKEHTFRVKRIGKQGSWQIKLRKSVYTPESIYGVRRAMNNDWNFWLDEKKKIAYVRIGPLESSTAQQLAAALSHVPDARGLILDLRWCPGGYLSQAVEIAGIFMEKGQVASVKYRRPERQGPSDFRADAVGLDRYRAPDYPVLVLVNGETMGGGELIAAALQDNGRAVIAGQRTLGKASIQSPLYIQTLPGWTFKMTAGTFVRPSGKNLQRFPDSTPQDDWGVRPDKGMEITVSPSLGKQLKDWNLLFALRPGNDREAMPLDDPEADAQRWIALKMLRKIVVAAEKAD